jgi:hypothetical protein
MRRSVLVILLVLLVSSGTAAHEGMIALVADPAMLDCDDGIEPGTLVNLYLYYMRGSDGPDNYGCAQFKLLCSSDEVFVLDPDWIPGVIPIGDVTEGIAMCDSDIGYCDDDQIFFGTIPIFNFTDNDTFTVSVVDPWFDGLPAPIAIVECGEPWPMVEVPGNSYTFNGKCKKKDDSPIVLGADAADQRTVTISFDEEVTAATAGELSSYLLIRSGVPDQAVPLGDASLLEDGTTVRLHLGEDLEELGDYSIFVDGVADLEGNPVTPGEPYSYALFTAPQVATLLQCFSATAAGGAINVKWELSEYDEGDPFIVTRGGAEVGENELRDIGISREGLSFGFTDYDVTGGEEYVYRVDVVTEGERRTLFVTEKIVVPSTPLSLGQNSPNPFNPVTTIRYWLPEAGDVRIAVFDVAGRRVRTLVNGSRPAGENAVNWNGTTDIGAPAAAGIYFYTLEYGKEILTRKMVLLK